MTKLFFKVPDINIQVYLFSFACYLSMVMSGVGLVWPSPLTEWYTSKDSEIPMTQEEVSWMVSIVAISAGAASVPFSMLADIFGRKPMMLSAGLISVLSWSIIMFTRTKWALYVAQVLGGIVVGGAPSVAPIYISEISPPEVRGSFVGQLNTMFFVGQLIVYAFGTHLSYINYIGVCFAMPILFFITFLYAPESPYFLLGKGRGAEAKEIMERLRGKDSLKELEDAQKGQEEKDPLSELSIWQALRKENYLKNIIILQVISCVNQFNGLATISVYVVEFMGGEWIALEMGIVFVVTSFFAAFLADPCGRRPLLISSLLGAAISTSFLTVYFIYGGKFFLYTGVFGFSFITSVGINPFIMTLPSELFPTRLRAFANGLTQLTTGVACFISLKIFVDINHLFGIEANFIIYTVCSLIGAVVTIFLPETAKSVISAG